MNQRVEDAVDKTVDKIQEAVEGVAEDALSRQKRCVFQGMMAAYNTGMLQVEQWVVEEIIEAINGEMVKFFEEANGEQK